MTKKALPGLSYNINMLSIFAKILANRDPENKNAFN